MKKIDLSKHTLRVLTDSEAGHVAGAAATGLICPIETQRCPHTQNFPCMEPTRLCSVKFCD